ncbi:MAG TPA: hypothetical protein VFQ00_07175 [Terriglobales bacterium]|nr:hypothetical protein [Terriglobales bacterium]
MERHRSTILPLFCLLCCAVVVGQQSANSERSSQSVQSNSPASLTIYNQDFAVVRQTLPLALKSGENDLNFDDVTEQVEPDSVILRDPSGKHTVQVLEQNYRSETASQQLMLSRFEGQTIDFEVRGPQGTQIVKGKIIRSGYVDRAGLERRFGPGYNQFLLNQYYSNANAQVPPGLEQPLIEVNGQLRFSLPGIPLFPSLPDATILKPMMNWRLASNGGSFNAELGYITGGLSWEADYNITAPPSGNTLDLIGWVSIDNHSGKSFRDARVELMAGDVNKIQPRQFGGYGGGVISGAVMNGVPSAPPITQKTFDEYHLYTLHRPVSLQNHEIKQVEFLRSAGIQSKKIYVYDGFRLDPQYRTYNWEYLRQNRDLGSTSENRNVWVMQEFKNSEANHLGVPLPRGRMRFYRQDDNRQLEFIGENTIEHTPVDETIRVYTGNAFDLVGERRRTSFKIDTANNNAEESFEIQVRNHKKESANILVVEHLYRAATWDITQNSSDYTKKDSSTIEFPITVPAGGEQKVTYTVRYNW